MDDQHAILVHRLRPEIEEALRDATQKIADGIVERENGKLKLGGSQRALLALVELGVRLGETEAIRIVAASQDLRDAKRRLTLLPLCDVLRVQAGPDDGVAVAVPGKQRVGRREPHA